jgi:uncharacterized protein DUF11
LSLQVLEPPPLPRGPRRLTLAAAAVVCALASAAGSGRAASPGPNVAIAVSGSPGAASLGHYVAYRVTVTSQAKNTVTHLELNAPASGSTTPFPLAYVSASPSTGSCSAPPSQPISCSFGSLRSGAQVGVTFVFSSPSVTPTTGAAVTFVAHASFDEGPSDQNASHTDTITGSAATSLSPAGSDFVTGFVPFALGDQLATGGSLDGPAAGNPQKTTLTVPTGSATGLGAVGTVQEVHHPPADTTSDCQAGFSCFGQTSLVTMPGLFSTTPLSLAFRFDASEVPSGMSARKLRMFHDGVLVPLCTTPGILSPGPTCQSSTAAFADKDIGAILLSSLNGSYRP